MRPFRTLALLALCTAPGLAIAADLTVTAANVKVKDNDSKVTRVRYGVALTQGQAVYKHTDGKYYKADADLSAAAAAATAIVITPGGVDEYGFVLTEGLMDIGATLNVGEIYVLSDVAGGVRPEADSGTGDRITILGVATAANVLWVQPFASGAAVP